MKPKRLTDRSSRMFARRERDAQWKFMKRVAREGVVWICPWDKHKRHGRRCPGLCASASFVAIGDQWQCRECKKVMSQVPDDGVYVFGLLGSNEFYHWLGSHKDWWKRGRWSEKRCACSIRITDAGRKALANRKRYDMEEIYGGMVEPGYVVTPWPLSNARGTSPKPLSTEAGRQIVQPKKELCICDGKKHWVNVQGKRVLRTLWKTNPYCHAHLDLEKEPEDQL